MASRLKMTLEGGGLEWIQGVARGLEKITT